MKKSAIIWAVVWTAVGLLLILWFCIPLTGRIFSIGSLFGILFGAGIAAVALVRLWLKKQGKRRASMIIGIVFGSIGALIVLWAGVMTGLMISGMTGSPSSPDATVVVLGCKVNGETPSLQLSRRTKAAAEYLKNHPEARCVASGGKGDSEQISEAEAIYRGLVEDGVEPERIVKEESSTNTEENLRFSKELIEKNRWNPEVVLVTDDYHQYRARLIAQRQGITSSPVMAEHSWHSFPANYPRELLAITKELIVK